MNKTYRHIKPIPVNRRLNRRSFLKTAMAASAASSIPFWMSCKSGPAEFTLNEKQEKIVKIVQEFLFPEDGNGPSAAGINAHQYFQWVLRETGTDDEDKDYLIKGIKWVDETSIEETNRSFLVLRSQEQQDLLEYITTTSWGESWLSMMLTIIFEALFCDPVYGGNTDQHGWRWLEHNPGHPRPPEDLKLGNFMDHVKQNQ